MTSSYFGGAAAVIIVFDLTDQKSFVAVEKWIKEAQSFSDQSRPLLFLIVGNKKGQFVPPLVVSWSADLEKDRAVSKSEVESLADKYHALYCETSAKTGAKVSEAFQMIGEKIMNDTDDNDRLA